MKKMCPGKQEGWQTGFRTQMETGQSWTHSALLAGCLWLTQKARLRANARFTQLPERDFFLLCS